MKTVICVELDVCDYDAIAAITSSIRERYPNASFKVESRYTDEDIQSILELVPEETQDEVTLALDEVVHDLKSGEASDINNSGLESQVIFLAESLGLDRAREEVLKARSGI